MPKTTLRQILSMLDADRVAEIVNDPSMLLRERYVVSELLPRSEEEALKELAAYYAYHWCGSLGVSADNMPPWHAEGQVRKILEKQDGGYVRWVKHILKGRAGGMIAAIDFVAEKLTEEFTQQYVSNIVHTHITPLDFEYRVGLMEQLIENFATPLLPGEDVMCAAELAANAEMVIQILVQHMNSLRDTLQ